MMPSYYFRLALKSFARNPGLSALMVFALALGIAACVVTLTVYRAMAADPIPGKSDRLFAVTMDSWDPNKPANDERPDLPPTQLTYADATGLFASPVPERKVIMYAVNGVVSGGASERPPQRVTTRVTSSDFFSMFEVPFAHGTGWQASADEGTVPVLVLSRRMNERLFGGADSVGRTVRWLDREFRVLGVLAEWLPMPRFYDVGGGHFAPPEDVYVPWGWGKALELSSAGSILCWKSETLETFEDFLHSDCTWVQMWVELADADARARMQGVLDAHWAAQRASGRFERPMNNRLSDVRTWLEQRETVQRDNGVLIVLAFVFLALCLVNTVGLLLAKFLNASTFTGVRRVLGARQRDVIAQHVIETGLLAGAGAVLGLVLGTLGLWGVRVLYGSEAGRGGYEELAKFDSGSSLLVIAIAVLATLVAGLYPAWRISRMPLAVYAKR